MSIRARTRLLRLADGVAGEDADLGDPLAQARLTVVVDALAHALVDLADGRTAPTQTVPWPPREDALRRPRDPRASEGGDDPASCVALAARLRTVGVALDEVTGEAGGAQAPGGALPDRVRQAVAALASALQDHAAGIAAATSTADRAEADRTILRGLRTAYELLSPDHAAR